MGNVQCYVLLKRVYVLSRQYTYKHTNISVNTPIIKLLDYPTKYVHSRGKRNVVQVVTT